MGPVGEASPRLLRLSAVLTAANSCHKFLVWTGPLAFSVCVCMLRVIIYLFIFDWKIISLQYSVGFCHTSTGISHRYTYVLSLLNLPSSPPHPSRFLQSPSVSSLNHTANSHWLSIFTCGSVYVSVLLSPFVPHSPSSPLCVHYSVLYFCVCIAALQVGSLVLSS